MHVNYSSFIICTYKLLPNFDHLHSYSVQIKGEYFVVCSILIEHYDDQFSSISIITKIYTCIFILWLYYVYIYNKGWIHIEVLL